MKFPFDFMNSTLIVSKFIWLTFNQMLMSFSNLFQFIKIIGVLGIKTVKKKKKEEIVYL